MARVLLVVFVIAVAFWVVSIVDCAAQPPHRHRGVNKTAWIAIVVFLPVLGGLLWFVIGRVPKSRVAAVRNAPDDDPAFLSGLGSVSDQDERIRRLEEELARLDAEEDTPSAPAPDAGRASSTDDRRGPRPASTPGEGDDDPRRGAAG